MTNKLRIPFTFNGAIIIECNKEDFDEKPSLYIQIKAQEAFDDQIESIDDLESGGFDFKYAEWID
jgi:hypothetical protein